MRRKADNIRRLIRRIWEFDNCNSHRPMLWTLVFAQVSFSIFFLEFHYKVFYICLLTIFGIVIISSFVIIMLSRRKLRRIMASIKENKLVVVSVLSPSWNILSVRERKDILVRSGLIESLGYHGDFSEVDRQISYNDNRETFICFLMYVGYTKRFVLYRTLSDWQVKQLTRTDKDTILKNLLANSWEFYYSLLDIGFLPQDLFPKLDPIGN